ncbi:hypothetical protein HU200_048080 [Digitaria exilis]|uniref:Cyclin-H1-1 n=1 Tax=Digitaria exilis TaxID=1010633 RepID=A0A835AWK1_9POAL|nr:hypothetical protein HU200_048080 [Digitaria exilis]
MLWHGLKACSALLTIRGAHPWCCDLQVEKWAAANQRAADILAQYGTTLVKVDEHDGSVNPPDQIEGITYAKPLSYEEEQLTRVFYEQKIQEVCGAFKFPHKIQATAIIFFKRFFLQWSVMEHHPKHIMLTCIYISCKVEENHVSAEELGKGIKQDHQIILNNEMVLLKTLDFDLIVYAPYRSIEGFIDDLEGFCREGNGALQRLKELRQTAISYTDRMILTDAPLIYTPGKLALAALHKSNDILGVFDFERYLETVFSRQHSECTVEQFVQSINAVHYLVKLFDWLGMIRFTYKWFVEYYIQSYNLPLRKVLMPCFTRVVYTFS